MEERNIVAIDLGTSKIAIAVARVEGDNTQVIYYSEHPSDGIDKSAVFNELKASKAVEAAVKGAEEALGIKINLSAVCKPKYYIKQVTKQSSVNRDPETAITADEIRDLMNSAKDGYELEDPEKEIVYGAVAQSYSDGEEFQILEDDIIGLERERLEGNFKIFIGRKNTLRRIDSVFNKVGVSPSCVYFTADTTARAVLSHTEMENGVALVDLGAGASSVCIYQGGIMRHYASIPFGGRSITQDIRVKCGISEKLAENIKKGYGVCIPSKLQNLAEKSLQIRTSSGNDRQIPVKFLSEIITARMTEIARAILYEIQESGVADELRCGIVLTGGGANLANVCNLFQDLSGLSVKLGYPRSMFTVAGAGDNVMEPAASCCIGMLLAAREDMKCSFTGEAEATSKPEVKITFTEPETVIEVNPEEKPQEPEKPAKQDNGKIFGDDQIEKASIFERFNLKKEKDQQKAAEKKRKEAEKKRQEEERKRQQAEKKDKDSEEEEGLFGRFFRDMLSDNENA